MGKIDLKRELKHLYHASAKKPVQVEVPEFNFLMINGMGDPDTTPEYAQAVEALFSVSYTAKFMIKKGEQAIDYAVMPLEGLWWAGDMAAFATNDRAQWQWTMMIMQPDFISQEVIKTAMEEAYKKKGNSAISRLRLESFTEGSCAQLLHVGPFSEEGPTIQRLHTFIEEHGTRRGKHHEIYLSDIRRAAPERWKTILRQPVQFPSD